MDYQILDWDSNFFGVKVARIKHSSLSAERLAQILAELRGKSVKLIYWSTDREFDNVEAEKNGGHLADRKITFVVDLQALNNEDFNALDIIEAYTESMPITEMENLAIQSGLHSRFATDPEIPEEKFEALYKIWIRRSIAKEIASEVLVIRQEQKVVGMITVGEKNGRGDIGLIAVDDQFRGKKYGERLVRAAQKWFIDQGFLTAQVVTQSANIPARKLYEKCGYYSESIDCIYHFWL